MCVLSMRWCVTRFKFKKVHDLLEHAVLPQVEAGHKVRVVYDLGVRDGLTIEVDHLQEPHHVERVFGAWLAPHRVFLLLLRGSRAIPLVGSVI